MKNITLAIATIVIQWIGMNYFGVGFGIGMVVGAMFLLMAVRL